MSSYINLLSLQVMVQHVSASRKNSADEKLRLAMQKFVDSHPEKNATLVLISGDMDFLGILSDFKLRKGGFMPCS